MKALLTRLALCGLAATFVGCVAQQIPAGGHYTNTGAVRFEAEGTSLSNNGDDPLEMAKARLAASVIAKANLLEKLKGAYVQGRVTVSDLMYSSQEAASFVEGWLARTTVEFDEPSRSTKPTVVTAKAYVDINNLNELLSIAE
ncbi:MAG: hypothetical protein O3A51_13725 [Verrucomicrobia bacterium]|nr:hypothetical protein [Verrucomicrobiota bacterium]